MLQNILVSTYFHLYDTKVGTVEKTDIFIIASVLVRKGFWKILTYLCHNHAFLASVYFSLSLMICTHNFTLLLHFNGFGLIIKFAI